MISDGFGQKNKVDVSHHLGYLLLTGISFKSGKDKEVKFFLSKKKKNRTFHQHALS